MIVPAPDTGRPPAESAGNPNRPAPVSARRGSWSLRLAAWSWGVAGSLFVLVPLAAALLLRSQYRGLMRNADRASELLEFVNGSGVLDTTDVLTAEQVRDALASVDDVLSSTPLWAIVMMLVVYVLIAGALLAVALVVAGCTGRAHQWARITGTVLAVLTALAVFQLWSFFAAVSWLPINALAANHIGLIVIGLLTAGIVFAWLPASNRAVRARAQELRARAMRFRAVPVQSRAQDQAPPAQQATRNPAQQAPPPQAPAQVPPRDLNR